MRSSARSARLAVVAVLAVVAGMLVAAPSAQATLEWQADTAHPYSDPTWLPLRSTAQVTCTYTNCSGPYHGYWAIDFIGDLGDPVYAAGSGVLHVGARDSTCKTTSTSKDSEGTWVWIDHGAGLVSRYHHLDTITVADGALVTPATQIGTMGHSGDFAPCTTNYLHFEVRTGGVRGTRIDPGQLKACAAGSAVSYPAAWGYQSWNSLVKGARTTPQLDNRCLPSGAATPGPVPVTTATRGSSSVTVRWSAPSGKVTQYLVYQELWSPSVSAWGSAVTRRLPPGTVSTTFTGLTNGRSYRYRVYARGAEGIGLAGPLRTAVPAAAPLAPKAPRWLTASPRIVRYAWWKAQSRGTPVTGYRISLRRWTASGWTTATTRDIDDSILSWKWSTMRPNTKYAITVRALSAAGPSAWARTSTVTTPRA